MNFVNLENVWIKNDLKSKNGFDAGTSASIKIVVLPRAARTSKIENLKTLKSVHFCFLSFNWHIFDFKWIIFPLQKASELKIFLSIVWLFRAWYIFYLKWNIFQSNEISDFFQDQCKFWKAKFRFEMEYFFIKSCNAGYIHLCFHALELNYNPWKFSIYLLGQQWKYFSIWM